MTKWIVLCLCLAAILIPGTAMARGDAAAGERKAAACAQCHGKTGVSRNESYPNLAGQKQRYLARKIREYKTGMRRHPLMGPVARSLTSTDIENLAAWYSKQPCASD